MFSAKTQQILSVSLCARFNKETEKTTSGSAQPKNIPVPWYVVWLCLQMEVFWILR